MHSGASIIRRAVLMATLPAVAALGGLQLGCSTTHAMHSGAGVPASEGTVKTSKGENGNTNLTVRVKHLAPPSKVASGATVYVVWIQPRNAAKQSVGALTLNDNLEGSLETVTPQRQFLLSVTPEPDGQVTQPTHEPVFTSEVDIRE